MSLWCPNVLAACGYNFLEQINASTPNDLLWLLRLLLAMFQKSDTARDWIVLDRKALNHLFSSLNLERHSEIQSRVCRQHSLLNNTLYCHLADSLYYFTISDLQALSLS